jgi:hypothetical protein
MLLAALTALAVSGCSSPPKIEPCEKRSFSRPPALVDVAVLACEVMPEARTEKFKNGDIVDYVGHGDRRIRVWYDREAEQTVIQVSHRGFGGAEGAAKALERIENWMKETDRVPRKQR